LLSRRCGRTSFRPSVSAGHQHDVFASHLPIVVLGFDLHVTPSGAAHRFENEAGDVAKDAVIRNQRDSEADRRRGDPSISVVLALAERVPDALAVNAQPSIGEHQLRSRVHGLGVPDSRFEFARPARSPAAPQGAARRRGAAYRSSVAVWNEMEGGRPSMIGSYLAASGAPGTSYLRRRRRCR
jgi:hypothetical protein